MKENKECCEYWIGKAREEAKNSPCLRMKFGAIIVKDEEELGRGHNKPPYEACKTCMRESKKITPRTRAEYCHAFHAEQWAVLNSLKKGKNLEGAVLIVAGLNPKKGNAVYDRFTCTLCARTMAAAGLVGIVAPASEGPKYRTMKEAYDEAYAVQEEIMGKEMNEEEFQRFLKDRK